jgi:4-amino-4-deoxy-L-arabinose transferase-like glycosyltransferase
VERTPIARNAFAGNAVLWAGLAALFFAGLGYGELFNPDESRQAEIAREMLASGRYLTPLLHGQPYYDKPVFHQWLIAGSLALFGNSEAAARLPSAAAALWTLAAVWWWTKRAYSKAAARIAVVGLATSPLFLGLGRFAILDLTFVAALTTAFVWLGDWLTDTNADRRLRPWSLAPFYAAIGVGVLIKGPVACVLGAMVATAGIASVHSWRQIGSLRPVRGALIIAAVCVPWFAAAWATDPDYIETFLWMHNVSRFLGTESIGHQHSILYYIAAIPLALLPWTPVVVSAVYDRAGSRERSAADSYHLAWAGAVAVFFLPAQTKNVTYLLPAWPALAALAANFLASGCADVRPRTAWERAFEKFWILLPAVAGAIVAAWLLVRYGNWSSLFALLPATAVAVYSARPVPAAGRLDACRKLSAATVAAAVIAYGPVADLLFEWKGVRSAALTIEQEFPDDTTLVGYRYPPHALAFYLGRTIHGTKDIELVSSTLAGDDAAVVIAHRKHLARLGFEPLPPGVKIVWENDSGRILLSNSKERR